MSVALLQHQPERALAAASRTTIQYIADSVVPQPIGWMKGLAHTEAGRPAAAAEEWRAAEEVVRKRLAAKRSLPTQAELAVTLALLGRKDEAAREFAGYEAAMREQGKLGTTTQVRYYAAMGDARRASAAIREARKTSAIWTTDVALARDPWFDRLRGKPEFDALLSGAADALPNHTKTKS
jgi:hypothetical protein